MTTLNYIIHGAGGIGCVIASRLASVGRKVQLVARGPHLQALQTQGLTLTQNTEGTWNLPAEASAQELDLDDHTVILLAMKTDDTFDAMEQHSSIYRDLPVVCCQNGVTNEEWLSARGYKTYGCTVMVGAEIAHPGTVRHSGGKLLEIGSWPSGSGEISEALVSDLDASGMDASVDERIIDGKWGKLVRNLANAYLALTDLSVQEASCDPWDRQFIADVNEEAADVLEAAEISARMVGKRTLREQIARLREPGVWPARPAVTETTRSYPSTWQDLASQRKRVEVDHFNGAIVRLGEKHLIPTPLNRVLRDRCVSAAENLLLPGSETTESLRSSAV
jgi:2-dehydropantoate 2-reductase